MMIKKRELVLRRREPAEVCCDLTFYLPLPFSPTCAHANKRIRKLYSRKEEEEAQAQEEEGRRQGPKLSSPRSGVESIPQRIPRG